MMTDAQKEARRKWDKANTITVSTRLSREKAKELREILTAHGLTTHTLIRTMCEWVLEGKLEQELRCIENMMSREQRNAELDAIVRGR